ncbi:transmembrane protein 25 [Limosa lapponica baueri]|uniref:Transmembrane protein 25 n=1 Tax=Limosa lapponica baueri TaxID=1758121 RepID=A0A2I0TRE6_LIMLA|nr:transmembrane protein 25 [Limosa lapponica baueri]
MVVAVPGPPLRCMRGRSAGWAGGSSGHAPEEPGLPRADAHSQQVEAAGLLLLLPVLVQANPPASITRVAQDRQVMANASEILLLGAARYPGLANFSISAANSVGVTTASLLPPGRCWGVGLLDARVELPLLGVAVGAALALGALLGLGSCLVCLLCRRGKPAPGSSPLIPCPRCSGSQLPQRLPHQSQSLPPDLRLDDLVRDDGAAPKDAGARAQGEENPLPGPQNTLVLSKLGFVQLPMSGRIYKVPSVSSDEIWL